MSIKNSALLESNSRLLVIQLTSGENLLLTFKFPTFHLTEYDQWSRSDHQKQIYFQEPVHLMLHSHSQVNLIINLDNSSI